MKKIILLILISFAFGQEITWSWEVTNIPITRENLFDYAEECYNDSTEKLGYYWYFGDDKSFIECDEMAALLRVPHQPECKKVWFHTTPTFVGFTKWLECKHGTFISSGDGIKICTNCGKGIVYDKKLVNKPLIIDFSSNRWQPNQELRIIGEGQELFGEPKKQKE